MHMNDRIDSYNNNNSNLQPISSFVERAKRKIKLNDLCKSKSPEEVHHIILKADDLFLQIFVDVHRTRKATQSLLKNTSNQG